MLIPYEQLDETTLHSLIEQYILREGTDYGEIEFSLAQKTQQIKQQLVEENIFIIYSEMTESVTLVSKEEFQNLQNN